MAAAVARRNQLREDAEALGRSTYIDSTAPISRYFNATRTMLAQARVYNSEGRIKDAYLLYWRGVTFFVERVAKHARYQDPAVRALKQSCAREVDQGMTVLEGLDKDLLCSLELELEPATEPRAHPAALATPTSAPARAPTVAAATGPASSSMIPAVQAALAAFTVEDGSATPSCGASSAYPAVTADAQFRRPEHPVAPFSGYGDLGAVPRAAVAAAAMPAPTAPQLPAWAATAAMVQVPSVRPSAPLPQAEYGPDPLPHPIQACAVPPVIPPQPTATSCSCASQPPRGCPPPAPTAPTSYEFCMPIAEERTGELRRMRLPAGLSDQFLRLAGANTARNVETCGILAGKLTQGEFRVTHVLVPSQTGSSDQCSTTDEGEEDACMYHVDHDLVTLGWIHTHPSQMCFFSSVDLHTQCGYQSMLEESIGIVLSPNSEPSVGVFRLTTPQGLKEVQNCKEKGFHPAHQRNGPSAGNGVYMECSHVHLDESATATIVDLRRGR